MASLKHHPDVVEPLLIGNSDHPPGLDTHRHRLIVAAPVADIVKALGGKIGKSLCEDDRLETAKELLKKAEAKGVQIHLPSDSIIADKFDANANDSAAPSNNIPDGWMGLDIGENACEQFTNVIHQSRTILWNGPMGVFEMVKFQRGTRGICF